MEDKVIKFISNTATTDDIPTDVSERKDLCRELLGFSVVKAVDYWIDNTFDYINNQTLEGGYVRENDFAKADRKRRDTFKDLDAATKGKISSVVASMASGVAFSILNTIDDFDFGQVSLMVDLEEFGMQSIFKEDDLHDELGYWIYKYSKHRDLLVVKEEDHFGSGYRLI